MPGTAIHRADGSDVDDVARAPLHHSLGGELGAEDDAEQVDVDRALGDLVGFVEERTCRADPGVVHQDIDGAQLAFDVVEERSERLAIGHVQACVEAEVEIRAGLFDRRLVDVTDGYFGAELDAKSARWRGRYPSLLP